MTTSRSGTTNRVPEEGYIKEESYQCLQKSRHAAASSSHAAVVESSISQRQVVSDA